MISSIHQRNVRTRFGSAAAHEQEQQHRGTTSDEKTTSEWTPAPIVAFVTYAFKLVFTSSCTMQVMRTRITKAAVGGKIVPVPLVKDEKQAGTNSPFLSFAFEMIKILVSAGLYMKDHTLIGLRSFLSLLETLNHCFYATCPLPFCMQFTITSCSSISGPLIHRGHT